MFFVFYGTVRENLLQTTGKNVFPGSKFYGRFRKILRALIGFGDSYNVVDWIKVFIFRYATLPFTHIYWHHKQCVRYLIFNYVYTNCISTRNKNYLTNWCTDHFIGTNCRLFLSITLVYRADHYSIIDITCSFYDTSATCWDISLMLVFL